MAKPKNPKTGDSTNHALGHLNNLPRRRTDRDPPKRRHTDIYEVPPTPEPKRQARPGLRSGRVRRSLPERRDLKDSPGASSGDASSTGPPQPSHSSEDDSADETDESTDPEDGSDEDEPKETDIGEYREGRKVDDGKPAQGNDDEDEDDDEEEEEADPLPNDIDLFSNNADVDNLAAAPDPAPSGPLPTDRAQEQLSGSAPIESQVSATSAQTEQTLPNNSHADTPDERAHQRPDKSAPASSPRVVIHARPTETPQEVELHRWLRQATRGSRWMEKWKLLWRRRQILRRCASSPMPEYLKAAHKMTAELQTLSQKRQELSEDLRAQIQNLSGSIRDEIKQVLHTAAFNLEYAQSKYKITNLVQAHLLPEMITLLVLCFRNFKEQGEAGYFSLNEAMELLLKCISQISSLHRERYVPMGRGGPKCLAILHPLDDLHRALEAGDLCDDVDMQSQSGGGPDDILHIPPSQVIPWSREEQMALLDGLQEYTGKYLVFGHLCLANLTVQAPTATY